MQFLMFNCCFYFLLVVHTYTHTLTYIHSHSMLTIKLIINILVYINKNEWRDRLKYPISNWLFQGQRAEGRRLFLK